MAHDKLITTLPASTSADPMFESISDEEMTAEQFKDSFCQEIPGRLSEGVALPFGDNENEVLCCQVTENQVVIAHTFKQRPSHPPLGPSSWTYRWNETIPIYL